MFNFFNSPMLKSIRRTFRPPTLMTGGDGSPAPFPLPLPGGLPEPDAVFGAEPSTPPVAPPPIAPPEPLKFTTLPGDGVPPKPLPLPSFDTAAPSSAVVPPSPPLPHQAKGKPPIGEAAASTQRSVPTLGVRDFREARDRATAEKFQKGLRAFEQEKSITDTRKDVEGFGDTENDLGTRKRARASFDSVNQNRENLRESMEETRSRAETSDGMRRVTSDEEEATRIKQDADRPRQAQFEANQDAMEKLDDIEARFGSSEVDFKNATKNVEESALKSMHEAHERVTEIQESLDLTKADIQQTEKLLKDWSKGGMFEAEHPVIGGEADKRLPKMQQRSINKTATALDLIGLGGGLIRDAMSNADKRSKLLGNLSINMRKLKDRESQLQDNLKAQNEFFGKRKMIFQALSDEIKRRHRPTRN